MAAKKDPTVTSDAVGDAYPEGTHPARPASETEYAAEKLTYKDNPDKPDPSSIAQVAIIPDEWPGGAPAS